MIEPKIILVIYLDAFKTFFNSVSLNTFFFNIPYFCYQMFYVEKVSFKSVIFYVSQICITKTKLQNLCTFITEKHKYQM
jgi:hypothetical protein